MKTNFKAVICFFILGSLVSCDSSSSKEPTVSEDSSVQQSVDTIVSMADDNANSIVSQAKSYEDTVFMYMSKAINAMSEGKTPGEKQASKEEMNNMAKPYQTKVDSLKALLPANKAKEIDDYKQQLFDQQTNKKKE